MPSTLVVNRQNSHLRITRRKTRASASQAVQEAIHTCYETPHQESAATKTASSPRNSSTESLVSMNTPAEISQPIKLSAQERRSREKRLVRREMRRMMLADRETTPSPVRLSVHGTVEANEVRKRCKKILFVNKEEDEQSHKIYLVLNFAKGTIASRCVPTKSDK